MNVTGARNVDDILRLVVVRRLCRRDLETVARRQLHVAFEVGCLTARSIRLPAPSSPPHRRAIVMVRPSLVRQRQGRRCSRTDRPSGIGRMPIDVIENRGLPDLSKRFVVGARPRSGTPPSDPRRSALASAFGGGVLRIRDEHHAGEDDHEQPRSRAGRFAANASGSGKAGAFLIPAP